MPPLLGRDPVMSPPMVPMIRRQLDKGKAPARVPPRRQYNDEPLPFKPASTAPRNAHIVGRVQAHDGAIVGYQLKIGEVEINDVSVDEILDYASALQLEQFEHAKFREEAEILKVLEEGRDAARREKLALAAKRARTKGKVFVQDGSDSEGGFALGASTDGAEVAMGRHGRARPDYSKFYKKPRGFGKKIFEDFADEDMADESMPTTENELTKPRPDPSRSAGPLQELPKRRRRKRDPITGELMPLESAPQARSGIEEKKRQRRKRHPQTGELMPLGWRYDPEAEGQSYRNRRDGLGSAMKPAAFKDLSISDQHPAKRPRLDTDSVRSSSASPAPTKAEIMGQAVSQHQSTPKSVQKAQSLVVDLMSSDSDSEEGAAAPSSSRKAPPKQAGNSMLKGTVTSAATTSTEESSPEPVATISITHPTATSPSASQRTPKVQQPKTSIPSPSAARASSTDPLALQSEDESDDDDDLEGGEWYIEAILSHQMSDPSTHPPELGHKSVMLYKVKWEGYEQPTWEPVESFGDRTLVDSYRKKVGLKALPPEENDEENTVRLQHQSPAQTSTTAAKSSKETEDEAMEDAEYEVERIVAHHLSDPRTHPTQLGKTPVMLFQVKWKGFDELTWEPEGSFDDDAEPLRVYKRRKGLK